MGELLGEDSYKVLRDEIHGDLGFVDVEAINEVNIDSHGFVGLELWHQYLIDSAEVLVMRMNFQFFIILFCF